MKLDRALAAYGLIDPPELPDYDDADAIEDDPQRDVRFQQIVGRLTSAIGLVGVTTQHSTYDTMTFLYNEGHVSFSWRQTQATRTDLAWNCGLIEAMTRRWLAYRRAAFPPDVRARIPARTEDWP